jgi:RimJ/RimL family protein N-acetyltransferase
MTEPVLVPMSDGAITIRPPGPGDRAVIVAGRDAESKRWLGEGSDNPAPTGCIAAGGQTVGWVDYDTDRDWLHPHQVNVGYQVFAEHRGHGYATRAVRLLIEHLAALTSYREATLLIDERNAASLAVAARLAATPAPAANIGPMQRFFVLTIRRHHPTG